MSKMYSAHPALALNQLQCAELEKKNNSLYNVLQNKWHNSGSPTLQDILVANLHKKTLPDRTVPKNNKDDVNEDYMVYEERDDSDNISKDCMNRTVILENEPETLQQRFNCRNSTSDIRPQSVYSGLNPQRLEQLQLHLTQTKDDIVGCLSGVSSTKSSPSASTVSTPLSTPTRLTPHHQVHKKSQFCCHKYIKPVSEIISSEKKHITTSTIHIGIDSREKCLLKQHGKSEHQTNHHTFHHHHHRHNHTMSSVKNGCKKLRKLDTRLGPSPYRQLLPIALCILSFAVVFSLLIIYMDTTEIRHQQFRLNMSRDYDMYGVAQDDPQLIEFLREIHMRKYPMHFLKSRNIFTDSPILTPKVKNIENLETTDGHISENILNSNSVQMSNKPLNFSASYDKNDLAPSMASYIATLVGNKPYEGSFIQSLPGSLGHLLTAPWLAETLNWVGIIVEPEARRYFALHKQNAQRAGMQVVQACVSPTPYPKEVTLHNEDSEVRINSLLDEETSWFNPRVKCFPLYTIMLACNRTQYDLLSLGVHGHELEILQTLPFEKLQIAVISIHLPDDHEDAYSGSSQQYIQAITQFLMNKSYKMQRQFGRNFFYQRTQHFTNRTRKKDILLLKTP